MIDVVLIRLIIARESCTRILEGQNIFCSVVLRLETLRKAWFFRIKGKGCGSIYLSQKAKCKSVLLSANFET